MSQTLDDYILLLGCGVQGLTEVGIVQGATGMEGHESLETGSHGLPPSWGITPGAGAKRGGGWHGLSDGLGRLPSPHGLAVLTQPLDEGLSGSSP